MSLLPQSGATKFSVRRNKPELVSPANATPYEFKQLSDIDDQEGLRFHIQIMLLYRQQPSSVKRKEDPVKIIREALAKSLVFYYPLAGRLREGPDRKLVVECTGEGALFIEADADFSLEQFSETLLPPFPYHQDVLYDVPGSSGIINCPLLLIQFFFRNIEMEDLDWMLYGCKDIIIAVQWEVYKPHMKKYLVQFPKLKSKVIGLMHIQNKPQANKRKKRKGKELL